MWTTLRRVQVWNQCYCSYKTIFPPLQSSAMVFEYLQQVRSAGGRKRTRITIGRNCFSELLRDRQADRQTETAKRAIISIFRPLFPHYTRSVSAHHMESVTFSSPRWWSKDTVAVVTGANKGVGYEIVNSLAEQGMTVVLTARDSGRGQAALDALKEDTQKSVWFHPLDVQSSESVQTLAKWLKSKFGGIDILVNNAGIAYGPKGDSVNYENAEVIIDTNYYGVKTVTEALLPLLRASPAAARIVNVTSGVGLYARLRSETLKQTFRDEDSYTLELLDSLAQKFLEDVKEDRWNEEGWVWWEGRTTPMYPASKILLNAYSIALANSLLKSRPEDHQILVASFTPGLTMTDLMQQAIDQGYPIPPEYRPNTPAEGADTGVWLALLPKEELAERNGKLFRDRKEFGFGVLEIGR